MKILSPLLLLFFSLQLCLSCRPKIKSSFSLEEWYGNDLNGNRIQLSHWKASGAILNFYSSTCHPCIKELPALSLLYQEAQKRNILMFLAVEEIRDRDRTEISSKKTGEKNYQELVALLKKDISSYQIKIPFLIMGKNFRTGSTKLIQATPETLFLRTNPLRAIYNFIGPISTAQNDNENLRNPRFQFALRMLNQMERPPNVP